MKAGALDSAETMSTGTLEVLLITRYTSPGRRSTSDFMAVFTSAEATCATASGSRGATFSDPTATRRASPSGRSQT